MKMKQIDGLQKFNEQLSQQLKEIQANAHKQGRSLKKNAQQQAKTLRKSAQQQAKALKKSALKRKRALQGNESMMQKPQVKRGLMVGGSVLGILGGLALVLMAGQRLKARSEAQKSDLKPLGKLDLNKFTGEWFEIARIPGHDDANDYGVKVNYKQIKDNKLEVDVTANKGSFEGKEKRHSYTISLRDEQDTRMLKHKGGSVKNYWLLDMDNDAFYAVLATPDRKEAWILCRTSVLPENLFEKIVNDLDERGFDIEQLQLIPQKSKGNAPLWAHLKHLMAQKRAYYSGNEQKKHLGPNPESRDYSQEQTSSQDTKGYSQDN